ncbi:phosphoribosylaminoimidazolesuccinocarboxamide synthase [Natronospira bacteriovora]|uniref:Phosphoribosylaminoimidazole-succinocarboxamide synthase n=1 Tax=Natronospira bacteriovora TaxID=3069753 RepID=A0ABU0W996_9GAMM|nr:phosphoribosylaminoimidazolesuccinocarboxamide synthase [Natronospira sp. AB-CW4]MDQ2070333.1 phosphoribosylaminoimidazolesuccinocarboxamide synthase [Natronospira sp. AB-CW4]
MSRADKALYSADIQSLEKIHSGKVRDLYAVDDQHLLVVASDRLSAFDVILPDPIPGKGEVLTAISNFWFQRTKGIVPNHIAEMSLEQSLPDAAEREPVASRAMVVRRLKPLPIEAIVRGYLIGSGWKDYQKTGTVCGIELPAGLRQADVLPQPLFTPSTKAAVGDHDENISFEEVEKLIGEKLAQEVRETSIALYTYAVKHAESRGLIIADTKFEFGLDENGKLHLIDEALTPDSSRFWPADQYQPGMSPPSFDKQFVRDYLETLDWDKTPPGPELPAEIIEKTAEKYREAQRLLTRGD